VAQPYAFVDLPAEAFPFTVELFQQGGPPGQEPLFRQVVDAPGALRVPGYAQLGIKVDVKITWADGTVTYDRFQPGAPS
jgi:hypothetical protein